jgi:peptidoglycan/LPS O-acetylase OafA/YrhL
MRIDQLTFTRFIAALGIVFFHFIREIPPFDVFFIANAAIGVSYFFVLSGFVMSIAHHNKNISPIKYYKARVARIYPVYFVALIAMSFYLFLMKELKATDFLLSLFAIQAWFPLYALAINYPAWSLSVEFFFYFMFPFILKSGKRNIYISAIIFWIFIQAFLLFINPKDTFNHNLSHYFPLLHLNEFLAGVAAGFLYMEKKEKWQRNYDWVLVGLFLLFMIVLSLIPRHLSPSFHDGLLCIFFVPAIVLLALNTGKITRIFNKKPFVFLGEISYSMYILQVPLYVFVLIILKRTGIENLTIVFMIFLPMLLLASAISYRYIETPMRIFINNFSLNKKTGLVKVD